MTSSLTEAEIARRLEQAHPRAIHEDPFPQFAGRAPRPAAVLIPLINMDGEWYILFTRRTDRVEHHKGQVAFPGGAVDAEDTDRVMTALREAEEEIGLHRSDVRVVGKLGEMQTVTNFLVTPVVGIFTWPYTFKMQTIEVNRVFTIPISWLVDRDNFHVYIRKESNRQVIAYYPFDGELLWGVTARITLEFLHVIDLLHDD